MSYYKIILALSGFLLFGCGEETEVRYVSKTIRVTATAYNSLGWQTQGDATLTAFGDTLAPGMKAIAVSRDLLDSGLTHQTKVKIEGLPGLYVVRDKMNYRWKKKIDIYMGTNVDSARAWGRRKVNITWVTDTVIE